MKPRQQENKQKRGGGSERKGMGWRGNLRPDLRCTYVLYPPNIGHDMWFPKEMKGFWT